MTPTTHHSPDTPRPGISAQHLPGRIIVASLLSICSWACLHGNGRAESVTIPTADLVGRWVLTPESIGLLRSRGLSDQRTQSITFRTGGTCEFQSYWRYLDRSDGEGQYVATERCKWSTIKDDAFLQRGANYPLTLELITGTADNARYIGTGYYTRRATGGYRIFMILGDPDSGLTVEFHREQ